MLEFAHFSQEGAGMEKSRCRQPGPVKTATTVMIPGTKLKRSVYVGRRGAKYVLMDKKFVRLEEAMAKAERKADKKKRPQKGGEGGEGGEGEDAPAAAPKVEAEAEAKNQVELYYTLTRQNPGEEQKVQVPVLSQGRNTGLGRSFGEEADLARALARNKAAKAAEDAAAAAPASSPAAPAAAEDDAAAASNQAGGKKKAPKRKSQPKRK